MNDAVRFIIITTPPHNVAGQIDEVRQLVCSVGRSRAALSYPPHVTLRTGAMVPLALVPTFIEAFGAVVGSWGPFPIRTEGLWCTAYRDAGKEKYLVGYRIVKDLEIVALNARLLTYTTWRASNRQHFEPHLTLAFDDLDLDGFVRLQHWLNDNPDVLPGGFSWTCDSVSLFRCEAGAWCAYKVWRE
jgi:2'-5' RNA ligase